MHRELLVCTMQALLTTVYSQVHRPPVQSLLCYALEVACSKWWHGRSEEAAPAATRLSLSRCYRLQKCDVRVQSGSAAHGWLR
jgi:hypothetical protein